jgi:hypothetical protein
MDNQEQPKQVPVLIRCTASDPRSRVPAGQWGQIDSIEPMGDLAVRITCLWYGSGASRICSYVVPAGQLEASPLTLREPRGELEDATIEVVVMSGVRRAKG